MVIPVAVPSSVETKAVTVCPEAGVALVTAHTSTLGSPSVTA